MYTEEDIYVMFRKAQSIYASRPYRLPKDFNSFLLNRMSKINRESLIIITKWFNSKWKNINPLDFFGYGFDLMGKKFTYCKFFDNRVHNFYITRDKIKKRDLEITREQITKSIAFIKEYMSKQEKSPVSFWLRYCNLEVDGIKAPIKHYLNNNIDRLVIAWIINKKYLTLSDGDRMLIPLIVDNYREYVDQVKEFRLLLEDV